MKPVEVVGLGLWTPGYPRARAWREGVPDPAVTEPGCEIIPARQRRATSVTTRIGAEVIGQAAMAAGVDLSAVKIVFGSAYGELQTALAQLEMIESEDGRLSPARFKNSVHNTVTGLLSIALGNKGFATALAAGGATFAMCLVEAMTLLALEGGAVVLGVADEQPGPPFQDLPDFAPLGAAICLTSEPLEGAALARITGIARHRRPWAPPISVELAPNPAAAALPLLGALLAGDVGRVPLELAGDEPWCVDLERATERAS